jgi:hypothetical protein
MKTLPKLTNGSPNWQQVSAKLKKNCFYFQCSSDSSVLRPEALQIFQKGQANWADFKAKIDNAFVATVTIPAAAGNN